MDALTKLEHVPKTLLDFFDWNTPNSLNLSDCYSIRGFHLVGKRSKTLIASRGIAHRLDEASLTVFGTKTR
jgi:hypothetical protein